MTETKTMTDKDRANRNAAIRWGSFVVGLLSLQVAGGIFAIFLATGDESVAVVPNYHQKALDWDQEIALKNASAKLGWTMQLNQIRSDQDHAGLQVRLLNREGEFVQLESGTIELYRHVRAANVTRVAVPAGSAGPIDLERCFDAGGLWQVSVDVRDIDANRFVASAEIDVRLDSGGAVVEGTP